MYKFKTNSHGPVLNFTICFQTFRDFLLGIKTTNLATLVISVVTIFILFCVKKFINPKVQSKIKVPIPIDIIVVSETYNYMDLSLDFIKYSEFPRNINFLKIINIRHLQVVVATTASYFGSFNERYGVKIIGTIPKG